MLKCPTDCEHCIPLGPCLICEHTIGTFQLIIKAEHRRLQAFAILNLLPELAIISGLPIYPSSRFLPEPAVHLIVDYWIGEPDPVLLVKTVAIFQIIHVNNFEFAPEIRSRITRGLFLQWANAFIEQRLGQFQQALYNSDSLDFPTLNTGNVNESLPKLGNFPDYETYLLLPQGQLRDAHFQGKPNIKRLDRLYTELDWKDIRDSRISYK